MKLPRQLQCIFCECKELHKYINFPLFGKGNTLLGLSIVDSEDTPTLVVHKWNLDSKGYARTKINGKRPMKMHRFLHKDEKYTVDHINRNSIDNRKCNLQSATLLKNNANRARRNTKHFAYVTFGGNQIFLGTFDSIEDTISNKTTILNRLSSNECLFCGCSFIVCKIPLFARWKGIAGFAITDVDLYKLLIVRHWKFGQYPYTSKNNKKISIHNMILPHRDNFVVDHKNGNTYDNRKTNLRYVTRQQNNQNRFNKTIPGLRFRNNRWEAAGYVDNKNKYLGRYLLREDAENRIREFRERYQPYRRETSIYETS